MTRILVTNADQGLLESLFAHLIHQGIEVVSLPERLESVDLARSYQVDLMIFDTDRPELADFEILQALRDDPVTAMIPVLMLTAKPPAESMRRMMALGADDYLIKPVAYDELLAAIRSRLHAPGDYEALQTRLAQLSEMDQLKTDMIRIAAHDLRNPLNSIAAALTLLRRKCGAEYLEENFPELQAIERAAAQMNTITSEILSLERIEALAQKRAYQAVDLSALVQERYKAHLHWAQQKGQRLEIGLAQTPIIVYGDPAQLREAIDNLLGNAIKYTPEAGYLYARLDKVGKMTRFIVEDSGYGIPEDQQAQLFQAFYRAKTAETAYINGTGLGLHLVKNIIERHNGQVLVQSVYGQGSVFGFFLPLSMASSDSNHPKKRRNLITRLVKKLRDL